MDKHDCWCEGDGCEQCDPEHYQETHLKWVCDGAETVDAAIQALEAFTNELRLLKEKGFEFSQPVDGSHFWLEKSQ
jgi:hypothetical protein